jgi:hypothetical protein
MGEGEDGGEVAGERVARSEAVAVGDDLLTDDPQVAERGAQRVEVRAELLEAQVAARSVEDIVLREVVAELGASSQAIASPPMRIRSRARGLSEMKPGMGPPEPMTGEQVDRP